MKDLRILLLMLAVAVLPAATHAQQDSAVSPPPVDVSKVQVIKMGADTVYFTPEELGETADSTGKAGGKRRINYNDPEGTKGFGYQYMIYTYPSVTSDGTEVTLSSLMAWPIGKNYAGKHKIKYVNNLIIGCHVTITSNDECPSKWPDTGAIEGLTTDVRMYVGHAGGGLGRFADDDNPVYWDLVIMPDYEGYGATSTNNHPYLDQELTARQVVDGVRYGIAKYNTLTYGKDVGERCNWRSGWKSIAVGYSQGGSVAMAVHRLIETGGFADELHFAGSVCGDGPYDILATMKEYISWDRVYYPVAAALILKGMTDHCPYIYHHQLSDYLSKNFLDSGIEGWINSKTYTTGDIKDKLRAYYKTGKAIKVYEDKTHGDDLCYMRMQDLLASEAYSYCKTVSIPSGQWYTTTEGVYGDLQRACEANSLCHGWQPTHPMYLLHSYNDHVVPYVNAESALKAFGSNSNFHLYRFGKTNVSPRYDTDLDDYGHNATGTKFLLDYKSYAKGKIGNSFEEEAIKAIVGNSSYASQIDKDSDWTKIK